MQNNAKIQRLVVTFNTARPNIKKSVNYVHTHCIYVFNILDSFKVCTPLLSEKYSIAQSFKLYLRQNSPLMPLNISASDYKGGGNIPGSHFVSAFSALVSHSL